MIGLIFKPSYALQETPSMVAVGRASPDLNTTSYEAFPVVGLYQLAANPRTGIPPESRIDAYNVFINITREDLTIDDVTERTITMEPCSETFKRMAPTDGRFAEGGIFYN